MKPFDNLNIHKLAANHQEIYQDIRFQLTTRPHLLENLNLLTEEQYDFFIEQVKEKSDPIRMLENHVSFILEYEVEKKTKQLVKEYAESINQYFGIKEKPKPAPKTLPPEILLKYAPPKKRLLPNYKLAGENKWKI